MITRQAGQHGGIKTRWICGQIVQLETRQFAHHRRIWTKTSENIEQRFVAVTTNGPTQQRADQMRGSAFAFGAGDRDAGSTMRGEKQTFRRHHLWMTFWPGPGGNGWGSNDQITGGKYRMTRIAKMPVPTHAYGFCAASTK